MTQRILVIGVMKKTRNGGVDVPIVYPGVELVVVSISVVLFANMHIDDRQEP